MRPSIDASGRELLASTAVDEVVYSICMKLSAVEECWMSQRNRLYPRCPAQLMTARAVPQYNIKMPLDLVDTIVDRVLQRLQEMGRVDRYFTRSTRPAVWTLTRTTTNLVGREADVTAVLDSLRKGAAVIWGGPGEGKTTVAMEAAARLHKEEPNLNGFVLDMQGEHELLPRRSVLTRTRNSADVLLALLQLAGRGYTRAALRRLSGYRRQHQQGPQCPRPSRIGALPAARC